MKSCGCQLLFGTLSKFVLFFAPYGTVYHKQLHLEIV